MNTTLDWKHYRKEQKTIPWKEREPLPRASHKKTSLSEFHFSCQKKVRC